MDVMLNSWDFVPSVMDQIFGVVFVTVKGPSHFSCCFTKTPNLSPSSMRYFFILWTCVRLVACVR